MTPFLVSDALREKLTKQLSQKEEIFPIASDPLLASLVTCLGLQFETGKPDWDRWSFTLGIDTDKYSHWKNEIITFDGEFGIRFWMDGVLEFSLRHPDYGLILHPLSLDPSGQLSQIMIFPQQVARSYERKNLELVIVRDWAMNILIAGKNYLKTNKWEIESNSAWIQTKLMSRGQVAFSGTHDLSDHLLDGDGESIRRHRDFYLEASSVYEDVFGHGKSKKISLVVSYLLGVVLDDMAQPRWYQSKNHLYVAKRALSLLKGTLECGERDIEDLELPLSFHSLMKSLRERGSRSEIEFQFNAFNFDLSTRCSRLTGRSTSALFQRKSLSRQQGTPQV